MSSSGENAKGDNQEKSLEKQGSGGNQSEGSSLFSNELYGDSVSSRREHRRQESESSIQSNLAKYGKFREGRCFNCRYHGQMGLIETEESKKRQRVVGLPLAAWLIFLFTIVLDTSTSTLIVLLIFTSPFILLGVIKLNQIRTSYGECPKCLTSLRF